MCQPPDNISLHHLEVINDDFHSNSVRWVCRAGHHNSPIFVDHKDPMKIDIWLQEVTKITWLQQTCFRFEYVYPIRLAAFKQHWRPFALLWRIFPQQTPYFGAIISPIHWPVYRFWVKNLIFGIRPLSAWVYWATQFIRDSTTVNMELILQQNV